ncbi:MAG: DNA-primase RepB domain-containing protein [Candidatus Krumholzibacteriia bacterium]
MRCSRAFAIDATRSPSMGHRCASLRSRPGAPRRLAPMGNHSPPKGGERRDRLRARDHTRIMLGWWQSRAVDHADIALRRSSGAMLWHRQVRLERLPLAWMRAENARGGEVYIRPARSSAWPLVFLDDVDVGRALAVATKYAALVVQTSAAGGCHLWLACDRSLDECERATAQRWLAPRIHADPASTSGEHLGRLAGFRNWKRHGVWVNVLDARRTERPWDPSPELQPGLAAPSPTPDSASPPTTASGRDTSPSGREWAWVCSLLEAGCDPAVVHQRLVEHARGRRGRDAERYARRTLIGALRRVKPPPQATATRSLHRDAEDRLPSPDAR